MMGIKIAIGFAAIILWATGLGSTGYSSQSSQDVRELAPGAPIEREISGSEIHFYRFTLAAHQFVRISLSQREVDLKVRVLGIDGQLLAEENRPMVGMEQVTFVVKTAGEYRLEVHAPKKDTGRGHYDLKIEELRAATQQDVARLAADKAITEGNRLRSNRKAESLRNAITRYEEAVPLYQAADDLEGQANALERIAQLHLNFGEIQKALERLSMALPIAQSLPERTLEAAILSGLGRIQSTLGNPHKALEHYDRSLKLHVERKDQLNESLSLNSIGAVNLSMGEYQKSLDYFKQSLALIRTVDQRGILSPSTYRMLTTIALHNIGETYARLGAYREASENLTQARLVCREAQYPHGEVSALNNIANVYILSGELQQALDCLVEAHSIGRTIDAKMEQVNTLLLLGVVYRDLGEPQKALDFLNQALALSRTQGSRNDEVSALNEIGAVYARMGEQQKALESFTRALSISQEIGNRPNEAAALYGLACTHRDTGNLIEAQTRVEAALGIIESVRSAVTGQQLRASWMASKRSYYDAQIDILMRRHKNLPSAGYDAIALEASERSRARGLLESLNEARAEIRQGVDPVLLERGRVLQQQLNAKAARLTQLLGGRHSPEEADSVRKEVESLITRYQELHAQIRATSPRYAALTQPAPLSLKEIQRQVLDDETMMLEYTLGEERSFLWAVTAGSIASFELPGRDVIETAARRVYELLTSSRRRQHKRESELATAELSRMLLGQVANRLGRKRLLIVADGALQYIPFSLLPKPEAGKSDAKTIGNPQSDTPLIAEHEIVSLPSASVLAVLRHEQTGRRRAERMVAVLSDPVFQRDDPRVKSEAPLKNPVTISAIPDLTRSAGDTGAGNFERLRFTRQEAEAIIEVSGAGESLKALDFDASRATVENGELDRYRIVHFATHGLLNSRHPELSGVVLSLVDEQGRPQDGFLRVHEIYNLKLNGDLVVLSACRTALGKEIKSEGLMGLTRGFMYAGTSAVVATLWDVRDEATAELMKRFYRGMLKEGMRPAAALRAAQVSMAREPGWQAPYYWAGFVLQGEWK
ncbi:MAG: CHAT domain-containing protein [Acidobacteria bacterium]|nr:CHAT domain-containing protein [Acidobacteriota bacterium]